MFAPASDSDLPAIVALMNRAYRGTGPAAGWSTEADYISGDRTTEALLRADIADKPQASLLAWRDHADAPPSGCVWLEPLGDGCWYLGSLAVEPGQQNGGLGRTLLAAAERWIADRGGRRVRMSVVNVRDRLIAWYVRRGYCETGETSAFPYDDARFGTPLRADLSFVLLEKALGEHSAGDAKTETA
jgi:ribosomal protein S18 acetylase RimI-like enzyme